MLPTTIHKVIRKTTQGIINFKRSTLRPPMLPVLRQRFSPRFFSAEPIPEKHLDSMFEAARWAPSGYNNQPWYFYWTRNGEPAFSEILTTLPDFNQWSKTAAVLVVACHIFDPDPEKRLFAEHDLGAAVMCLVIQAQALGYYCRQMGVFDKEKLLKKLPIAKDHSPFVILALGELGDYRKIDEALWQREIKKRERKSDLVKRLV